MAKPIKKIPQGFTMVELIVYLGITTIALLVFTSFMADVTKSATKVHISQEVQQNARLLLSQISQNIRTAQSVQVVNAQTLAIVGLDGETATYSLSEDTLEYQIAGSDTEQLSNERVRVTDLIFEMNESAVSITLTVEQKSEAAKVSQQDTLTLESTVVPRQSIY